VSAVVPFEVEVKFQVNLISSAVSMKLVKVKVKVNVKQSLYRPGVSQRVPGS
jgi:hypothetical protein